MTPTSAPPLLLTDATKLKVDLVPTARTSMIALQEAREALEGYIVSYSKDSDGLYTLTKRSDNRIDLKDDTFNATGLEIKSGTSAMKIFATDDYYANSSTIFLLYDGDDYTVYTGIKNVPDVKGDADTNAVVFDKGSVAKVVYHRERQRGRRRRGHLRGGRHRRQGPEGQRDQHQVL